MTVPSSSDVDKTKNSIGLVRGLVILLISTSILLFLWKIGGLSPKPYVEETLNLQGSLETGEKIFKINCAGCHGIEAQGLLGPNLHEISSRRSDAAIIRQVIEGRTPPMPSFQIDTQSMANLLKYLHSIH